MKNFVINISRKSIFDRVSLNSEYAGAKTNADDDFYRRVATVSDDEVILSGFWTELCGETIRKFQNFLKESTTEEETLILGFEMSNAYDESLTPSVESDISNALSAGMSARWFQFTDPTRAQEWRKESEALLERAFEKLCHRKRPVRK